MTVLHCLGLNHRTAPDLPTVWAVRMSMGCPFAWPEVIWQPEWGAYRGRDLSGHRVVDGGLLSNFPIKLLVSSDEFIDEIMGEDSASETVIGFLIDETLPVPGAGDQPPQDSTFQNAFDRLDVLQETIWRIRGLADTMMSAHDMFITENDRKFVCRLPAKGYGTLEFDMPAGRMQAILQAGETAMEAYFTDNSTYTTAVADLTPKGFRQTGTVTVAPGFTAGQTTFLVTGTATTGCASTTGTWNFSSQTGLIAGTPCG